MAKPQAVDWMIRLLWFISLLCFSANICFAHVGEVSTVHGNIGLERGREMLSPRAGADVLRNDLLRSEVRSSARLNMDDGSILSIGSNTILKVNDYLMDEDKSVIRASIELVHGWLQFGVAKLHSGDSSYRFRTPSAVLGIRGTEGIIEVVEDEEGVEFRLFLKEGAIEIAERERDGKLSGKIILLKSGQYVSRKRDERFKVLDHLPPEFQRRMPESFKTSLKKRSDKLRKQGITPEKLKKKLKHRPKQRLRGKASKRRQGHLLTISEARFALIRQRFPGTQGPDFRICPWV